MTSISDKNTAYTFQHKQLFKYIVNHYELKNYTKYFVDCILTLNSAGHDINS